MQPTHPPMHTMITRRDLLAGLAGTSALVALSGPAALAGETTGYVTTCRRPDGTFALVVLTRGGEILHEAPTGHRCHDLALSPGATPQDGTAVLFARRPGRFALVLNLATRTLTHTILAAEGRHFYGHGFFSADGHLLYATENAYDEEKGVLGVYDVAAGYRRIGELSTGGIGPHEAIPMADGRTLAVANGGILTHPDFGRRELNIATMTPSLAYVDAETGDLIERVKLPADKHQLSIRHIGVDRFGAVWFGCQYLGPAGDATPLVGRHTPGGEARLAPAPDAVVNGLHRYIGAVAVNRSGTRVAATSPRGGALVVFAAKTGDFVKRVPLADTCGLAPGYADDFLFSNGLGALKASSGGLIRHEGYAFDNHMRSFG